MKIIVNTVHEWIVQVSDNCLVVDVDPYESITDEQMKEATDHGVKLTSLLDEPELKQLFVCSFCATRHVVNTGDKFVKIRMIETKQPVNCAKCSDKAFFEIQY